MERIPVLQVEEFLLVSVQVDMQDRLALALQEDLSQRLVASGAQGVLIDISALDIVDSFIGRVIANIAAVARLMDAETVVVGMRPAVAMTLVELGLTLPGVRTALNIDQGMRQLRRAVGDTAGESAEGDATGGSAEGGRGREGS